MRRVLKLSFDDNRYFSLALEDGKRVGEEVNDFDNSFSPVVCESLYNKAHELLSEFNKARHEV